LRGEVVLDIGTNEGVIPIELAGLYKAHWCEGIDIDTSLIKTANKTLRELRYQVVDSVNNQILKRGEIDDVIDSDVPSTDVDSLNWKCLLEPLSAVLPPLRDVISNILRSAENDKIEALENTNKDSNCFPFNLRFSPENLAIDGSRERSINEYQGQLLEGHLEVDRDSTATICGSKPPDLRFSMITMFSVVKWIHIAYGDAVLKRLFRRTFNLLCHGGYFVLEPQNWHSYRNARRQRKSSNSSPDLRLEFKPHQFDNYLVTKIGYERYAFILPNKNEDKNTNEDNPDYIIVKVGDLFHETTGTIIEDSEGMDNYKYKMSANGCQETVIHDEIKEGSQSREKFQMDVKKQ